MRGPCALRPAAPGRTRSLDRRSAIAIASGLLLMTASPALAAEKPAPYATILDGPGRSVVAVRYQLKPKERPKGGEGPKSRRVTAGIVTAPRGLVMINASSFPDPDDGPDVLEPFNFKIVLEKGREIEASVAGISRDLNLAFLTPKEPLAPSVPAVSFDGAPDLAIGDEVVVVGLMAEPYAFRHAAYQVHVNGRPLPSKPVYSFDAALPDLCAGGLVVRPDGRPVGFVGVDLLPEAWDGNEAGNLLSLLGSANQGQRPGYLMIYEAALFAETLAKPPTSLEDEKEKRGWLGITMQPLSRDLAAYWGIDGPGGVILGAVLENSPAAKAGLQPGDVILRVDGDPIPVRENRDLSILQKKIRRAGAGRDIPITIWRAGGEQELTVRLTSSPTTVLTAEEYTNDDFGITVRELTYDLVQLLNLSSDTHGVVVSKTERAGWAEVAGIDRGDIVQKVDGAEISGLDSFREALERSRSQKRSESLLLVLRAYKTRFVRVRTDWK